MQSTLNCESDCLIDFAIENFNSEGVLELRKSFSEEGGHTLIMNLI